VQAPLQFMSTTRSGGGGFLGGDGGGHIAADNSIGMLAALNASNQHQQE
jgi:hypothetical protein